MAEKLTTFVQLKKLAVLERNTIGDKISELAGLMAEGLEDARHISITVTLPAANWNNQIQTVKHESLLADSSYWYLVYNEAGVKADDVSINGEITFHCESIPENDLTVNILRLEVEP